MMSLVDIAATLQCEGCGIKFRVVLPNKATTAHGQCLMDLALDGLKHPGAPYSYIAETVLCRLCTCRIDLKRRRADVCSQLGGPKERWQLTRTWILQQLGAIV